MIGHRIQHVTEVTGVPAATLRAWERRYGIPAPRRSESGYRVYAERDISQVKQLRALVELGVAPAEAARRVSESPIEAGPPPTEKDAFTVVRERVLEALDAFDPDGLEAELRRALVLGSAAEVYDRVLVPVMQAVGERWGRADLTVAHEHLASEVLRAVAGDLLRLVQPARPVGRALLACFADEAHALPLQGIAFRLAQRGIRSVLLGARTPPEAIAYAVARLSPDLVGLSVTVDPEGGEDLVAAYAKACGGVPWAVGGSGVGSIAAAVVRHGGAAIEGPDGLERLLQTVGGRATGA